MDLMFQINMWRNKLRRIGQFVEKLWAYKGILWRDFDWDYAYLYYLLLFKLKRMERALEDGIAIREKHNVQSLRLCIVLLERIVAGEYIDRVMRRHERIWGEADRHMIPIPDKPMYTMETTYPNATTSKLHDQATLEALNGYMLAERMEERDRRNLFAIMGKYLPYWWD